MPNKHLMESIGVYRPGLRVCRCSEPVVCYDHAISLADDPEPFCLTCDLPIQPATARKLEAHAKERE